MAAFDLVRGSKPYGLIWGTGPYEKSTDPKRGVE